MNKLLYISFFLLVTTSLFASELRKDSADYGGFLELGTANDLFQNKSNSDKYYSASFRASYMHSYFDNNVVRKALLGDDKGTNFFGLVLRQNGYTPEDLSDPNVIEDDRPYAGTLTLQYWRVSKQQLDWEYASAFKFGVLGPASMLEYVQKGIHKATGSTPPMGWDNQIANALVIDYYAKAERIFLQPRKHIQLGLGAHGEVGSLLNAVGLYSRFRVGQYNEDPKAFSGLNYRKGSEAKKWQFYVDFTFGARYVLYDGTLQGGLLAFNESPHTFSHSDYEHFTTHSSTRFTFSYQNFMLVYTVSTEMDRFAIEDLFHYGTINFIIPIGAR